MVLSEQGKAQGFFNNVKNADRLGGLVEDIRDAMMEYLVCVSRYSLLLCLMSALDFVAARYQLSAYRESHLPAFRFRG